LQFLQVIAQADTKAVGVPEYRVQHHKSGVAVDREIPQGSATSWRLFTLEVLRKLRAQSKASSKELQNALH
jgi:hypothetical protein